MDNRIIDNIEYLMSLDEDELNETLIDNKYNRQNLRELVRRTLKKTNEYKKAFEYEISEEKKETEMRLQQYQNEYNQ